MRMAGPDIVLFVIGALLFGGATYAIVSQPGGFGGATSQLDFFTVTYGSELVEVDAQTAATLRSATQTFDVTIGNVSEIEISVLCTGTGGDVGPVVFQLAVDVQGPNGLTGSGTGSCAAGVVVSVPITAAPEGGTVRGSQEAEARANLPVAQNATTAQGAWTVTITGSRGGTPSPLPTNPTDPAGTIVMNAQTWTPRLEAGAR